MRNTKLLVGITGSVGVIHIPVYLYVLREKFPNLRIILTEAAMRFIPKQTVSLICEHVYTNLFPFTKEEMNHVQLANWADLFVILPATAQVIAQASHGLADTLLTATILTYEKSIIFFPNMNDSMWMNPAMKRNRSLLRESGHQVIEPIERVGYEAAMGVKNYGGYMPLPYEALSIIEKEADKIQQTSD